MIKKRPLKLSLIAISVILVLYYAIWYMAGLAITRAINSSGRKISFDYLGEKNYIISCASSSFSGFPGDLVVNLHDVREQSSGQSISYAEPVEVGYNFLSQKLSLRYSGDVQASYEPREHNFGSKLSIENYVISIYLKNVWQLVKLLNNDASYDEFTFKNFLNYLNSAHLDMKNVQGFDLIDGKKFYAKEYERVSLKAHSSNFGGSSEYSVSYSVKTLDTNESLRKIPLSAFLPPMLGGADLLIDTENIIKLQGENWQEFSLQSKTYISSPLYMILDVKFMLDHKQIEQGVDQNFIDLEADCRTKPQWMKKLLSLLSDDILSRSSDAFVDADNSGLAKEFVTKFDSIARSASSEDYSEYKIILKMHADELYEKMHLDIDPFIFEKDNIGINIRNKANFASRGDFSDFYSSGTILLKNYPEVLAYLSDFYLDNVKKPAMLPPDAHKRYKSLSEQEKQEFMESYKEFMHDVNMSFVKSLSSFPNSDSADLEVKYLFDSNNPLTSHIGNMPIDNVLQEYKITVYKTIFDQVGYLGDVENRIKKLVPGVDMQDKQLQNILTKIKKYQKQI
jgi:hypothetical protein